MLGLRLNRVAGWARRSQCHVMRRAHGSMPPTREQLPAHRIIPTRVQDTDLLGHINNVNYYAFMDSAICDWSAAQGDKVADSPRYVVETGLRYHAPAHYPEKIEVRFGVEVRRSHLSQLKYGYYSTIVVDDTCV